MVKAGQAVDDFIAKLAPLLSKGDIIIDGGNSEHQDTTRRCRELEKKGLLYVGSGVSGGEEGARYGPSLMPGGHAPAWPFIKDLFQVCNLNELLKYVKLLCHFSPFFLRQFVHSVKKMHAVIGLATKALVISSKWFIMVLSMVTCNLLPRPIT